jgi:Bacterial regulatory protein, Fis family
VRLFRLRIVKDRREGAIVVTEHDVLVGYRLQLFTLADELGNVTQACRLMGVHRSTFYR